MSGSKADQPASAKKLKQACLPFKLVNSPGTDGGAKGLVNSPGTDGGAKGRKRKLSGTENDEVRVENRQVEPVNGGGAKRFIKSDDEDAKESSREISYEDINNEGSEESVKIASSENCTEETDKEINDLDSSKIDENVMDVDDVSESSNPNLSLNNISVISSSENGKLENITQSAKKLTPTQLLKKKQESAKKQEERERLKQEREKAKEAKIRLKQLEKEQKKNAEIEAKRLREVEKEKEKQQKEEERKAKELEKERERKQKEEEKKAKELEKEKEKKQKEEERKAKELEREKEKKQKEEERKAKELEKEKLKEEKLLKEEMEKKKNEKVKAAFIGYFKPKSVNLDSSKNEEEKSNKEQETYFMPFQTKQDMKIAPFFRASLNCDRKLIVDKCINQCEQNKDLLYLNLLKTGKHKPSKSEATWPIEVEDDTDVIIVETGLTNDEGVNEIGTSLKKNSCKYHWKLLQFHENKRPPYCGTWRKKSLYVKPRRPFACDKIMFDYEVDSDDEWEEEDPGESIHGTDDEVEPEDDYEVDNDVFVPHGYLSDEEGDGQYNDNVSEEVQKEKLKLLGEEFEAEIKKKTERIKPRLVGCIWIPNDVTNPENMSKSVSDTLLKYRCVWDGVEPIVTETAILEESPKDGTAFESKKTLIPDSVIPNLITFVHGSTNGIRVVAKNFIDELVKNGRNVGDGSINISSVKRTIKTIATKSTHISPWSVGKDSFEKYGIDYPKIVENEVPKSSKFSSTKITSFLTPQSQNEKTLFNKSCIETDQNVSQFEQIEFVPKNLFDVNENPKPLVKDVIKQEQKVNIVGGKKRITPVLLSPKKSFKSVADKKLREKSLSPKLEFEVMPLPNDETVKI